MDELYKVYIKLDNGNKVVAVNSSAFLSDTEGWIEIDNGSSDKFHHAQNNYFDEPLIDGNGLYNYTFIDGKPVKRINEDKALELNDIQKKTIDLPSTAKLYADVQYLLMMTGIDIG